ncbi:MAG: chemotaxis protein CheA, partial [Planctomycetes bacterium]|nr:chemotaxis protein CheA [Planctomycetota bacterium]
MAVDLSQFHTTYFEESLELLESMETALIGLGPHAERSETIHSIFRAAHSIKGGAGTFGFQLIADFVHTIEAVLDRMRSGEVAIGPEVTQALLESVDVVRSLLESERRKEAADPTLGVSVQARLLAFLGESTASLAAAWSTAENDESRGRWCIDFRPHPEMLRSGNDPLRLIAQLTELGPVRARADLSRLPDFDELDPEEMHLGWTLALDTTTERRTIEGVFEWVLDLCDLWIDEQTEETTTDIVAVGASAPASSRSSPARERDSQSIRVSIAKIDDLMNMVGELVITQSMLQQVGDDFSAERSGLLRDKLALLDRNTRELQECVMRIRMLPISFAFNRLPRMVHDLGRKFGKQVELCIVGEQTELDKTVMEKIGDPLTHLVRNAIDHGIERPGERKRRGKPEMGRIDLVAYHEGGNVVIEIRDDGRGISRDRVLANARERGWVDPEETLGDAEILDLIFRPGLTTAEEVNEVSGRGVGMDVVRRNIESIGGSLTLHSEEGQGSQITIRLPLTLSILDGQTVRVGGESYILPLLSIVESIQIDPSTVSSVGGRIEVIELRGEILPILRIHRLFDVAPRARELADGLLVIVEHDRHRFGLFVDELLAQQQVVIKSLETNFRRVEGISGATILGDGTVALILDVPGLIRLQSKYGRRQDRLAEVIEA